MRRVVLAGLLSGLLVACGSPSNPAPEAAAPTSQPPPITPAASANTEAPPPAAMSVRSQDFEAGGAIPQGNTCDGEDLSPVLQWNGVPAGAVSLALIMDDPNAGGWVHWVVYDLPPELEGLPGGVPEGADLPEGGRQGANTWGAPAYGGPCPPSGEHRYVFILYALDSVLGLPPGATAEQVVSAAEGHVLGSAELSAYYQRR